MSSKPLSVDLALNKARTLARKGARDQALELYRAVLRKFPGNKRAIEGLKALSASRHGEGRPVPNAGPPRDQIGALITLYNQKRLPEAMELGTALARKFPATTIIHNILGAVNADLGLLDQAVASYTRALQIEPDYAEAHGNLGNALVRLGKHDAAIASYARSLHIKPENAEAHCNLGNALSELGKHEEAIANYTKALRIRPDFATAHYNLGNAFKALGIFDRAIASYTAALQIQPGYADAHANLGNALEALGQDEQAIASYSSALMIQPDNAEVHGNLGNVLADLGNHQAAIASYTEALRIKPDFASVQRALGSLRKYQAGDPRIAHMQAQIANPDIAEDTRMHLSFALGKACDDLGDTERAFGYFLEGNRLMKRELGYDIGSDKTLFALIRSIFEAGDPPAFEETRQAIEYSKRPIFIVGMPRSGTTLAEQILASHSQVHGAGELNVLNSAVLPALHQIQTSDDGRLTAATMETIRRGYLAELDKFTVDAPCITDKMPLNFRWIGFILTSMPDAKIINLQRDPIATCWSIFTNYFRGRGNGFAYDLVDIAEFYRLYADMMDFWRERFPNRIYDLDYEALTESQEQQTRRLLDYCGLDWEDQCLEFHKTGRVVKTASSAQVRQEIYQGSSAVWRKYEPHIGQLIHALDA